MSHAIEVRTTILPGHRIEVCVPELPEGSAAMVQIRVDESDSAPREMPIPDFAAAERLYLQDLPELLNSKAGRWVAYTSEGLIAEGDDELALFRSCYERGFKRGHFLVTRVEPDLPTAEITENWFPDDQ